MQIIIDDNKCWICGKQFNNADIIRTKHHGLPQHTNPVNNILLPVCEKCHMKEINTTDISGLYKFAYRMTKELQEMTVKVNSLTTLLDNLEKIKVKK